MTPKQHPTKIMKHPSILQLIQQKINNKTAYHPTTNENPTSKPPQSSTPSTPPGISPWQRCHATRCRLRIWTWRHGSGRNGNCRRRQQDHILEKEIRFGCRLPSSKLTNCYGKFSYFQVHTSKNVCVFFSIVILVYPECSWCVWKLVGI